jgi:hypothetical protein
VRLPPTRYEDEILGSELSPQGAAGDKDMQCLVSDMSIGGPTFSKFKKSFLMVSALLK